MKLLVQGMKRLPKNQQNLSLNLKDNNLGENPQNLKQIRELLKYLPNNNLNYLQLNLSGNNLGQNTENFKYLA